MRVIHYALLGIGCFAPLMLAAQETPPVSVGNPPSADLAPMPAAPLVESTKVAPADNDYTTKPQAPKNPFGKASDAGALAPQAAAPAAPNAVPASPPGFMPFGKSTAAVDREMVVGPKATSAVPVGDVDAIETGEPAPATPIEDVANPAKEDPAQPTQLTAPIFSAPKGPLPRSATVQVLNKVTARAQRIELKSDQPVMVGKLVVTASHCQHSDPSSLPDDAALITVSEAGDAKNPIKPLFSGWIYQSSPSINALESPIYDVSLVGCNDAPAAAAKAPVPETKAKK